MKNILEKHLDIIEALSVGGVGMYAMFTDVELILKCLIGVCSLGYVLWKWRVDYLKNKKENA